MHITSHYWEGHYEDISSQVEQILFSIERACLFSGHLSGSQGCTLKGGFTVPSISIVRSDYYFFILMTSKTTFCNFKYVIPYSFYFE